jgi:hypothetical protein
MAPVDSPHPTLDYSADHSDAASMCLNMHFIHPLVENQDERPLRTTSAADTEFFQGGNLAFDSFPDDFLSQFTFDEDQMLLVIQ